MYLLCIIVYLVFFVFITDTQNTARTTQNIYKIGTRLILQNGTSFECPHANEIFLKDNVTVQVEMTHTKYINHALVIIPSYGEKDIAKTNDNGQQDYKKRVEYTVSPKLSGKWIFKTLTGKDTSAVLNNQTTMLPYKNSKYYNYQCEFNIKVSGSDNDIPLVPIIGGVLALIIIIQTGVICYLKVKRIRRIEQMALSNTSRGNDTARYSTTPGRKPSLKTQAEDIYETLEVAQQSGLEAPPPPPIETLPRPAKADKIPLLPVSLNQPPVPPKTPALSEDERLRLRPAMPLPIENEVSVHMRPKGKGKIPAPPPDFAVSQETVTNTKRKLSTIKQDVISNELNNILKKRQAGPKPQNLVTIPKPVPETKPKIPVPMAQALKPLPPVKPTAPTVSPATPQPAMQRPTPSIQKPNPPPIASKSPWGKNSPQPHPMVPPLPHQPIPSLPHPSVPSLAHPMHSKPNHAHPTPSSMNPGLQRNPNVPVPPTAVPVLPVEYAEEPEYADYDMQDDDSADEWTYEPLDPPSKYDYNIYSS